MKNNPNDMMCLDLFLSNSDKKDHQKTIDALKPISNKGLGIMSWGIHDFFYGSEVYNDLNSIRSLSKNYQWENNFNSILKENTYEALVITNFNKKVIWVNNGFQKMTGYDSKFIIDKSPNVLQGKNTSEVSKQRIRKRLLENKPFKEIIINYRKDNTEYKCELHVFPLYTKNSKTTHFLALEKEAV